MSYLLGTGGDISIEGEERMRNYDRIEFCESGVVVCINKAEYAKDVFPRERVESVHTHTSDEEESAEWW
jgi:hypothetical protein